MYHVYQRFFHDGRTIRSSQSYCQCKESSLSTEDNRKRTESSTLTQQEPQGFHRGPVCSLQVGRDSNDNELQLTMEPCRCSVSFYSGLYQYRYPSWKYVIKRCWPDPSIMTGLQTQHLPLLSKLKDQTFIFVHGTISRRNC